MDEIIKALKDLVKALENNKYVAKVTFTITLAKPKPDKAKQK